MHKGERVFSAKAGLDFTGVVAGGRSIGIEAKETSEPSLPLEKISAHQVQELGRLSKLGAVAMLVVSFDAHGETFSVGWPALEQFLAAPWRESLSLYWCRAYGLLVPELARGTALRRCLFLDGEEHPHALAAQGIVIAESQRAGRVERQRPANVKTARKPLGDEVLASIEFFTGRR